MSPSLRLALSALVSASMSVALYAQTAAPTLPPAMQAPTDPHTLAVLKEVRADQGGFGPALHSRDYATIEKLWAPELLVNGPGNKVLTRAQILTAIREGKLDYRDTHTVVESFSTEGDTAIQMGHEDYVPLTGPEAGKTLYRRFTNVFLHRDGHWVLLARQATIYDPTAVHY